MRCVLIGLPGSGKGTQAHFLSEKFEIAHVSTGDTMRAAMDAGTPLGLSAKAFVERGELVPDDIVIDLVKERLRAEDCEAGFVIDGFPRTVAQADALRAAGIDLDYVIEMNVPEREVVRRMSGRLVHPASGRVYHVEFNPPRVPGKDDVTGDDLVTRSDDREDIVRRRIGEYYARTVPIVSYYIEWERSGDRRAPRFIKVFAGGTVAQVRERMSKLVRSMVGAGA